MRYRYRALAASNSPALRMAIVRAEARAGRSLDRRAVAAGVHSHSGGDFNRSSANQPVAGGPLFEKPRGPTDGNGSG